MKLLRVGKSSKPDKKYMAVFEHENGRQKTTHFGAAGMDDFLKTGDVEQRKRYRDRHKKDRYRYGLEALKKSLSNARRRGDLSI